MFGFVLQYKYTKRLINRKTFSGFFSGLRLFFLWRLWYVIEIALASEQPQWRDIEIHDEMGEPRHLEHITRLVFFEGVKIPPVDAIAAGESLLPADYALGFKPFESEEETGHYGLTFGGLHGDGGLTVGGGHPPSCLSMIESARATMSSRLSTERIKMESCDI